MGNNSDDMIHIFTILSYIARIFFVCFFTELSFFSVAMHELGHALGISHSNVKNAIMHGQYQRDVMELKADDIRAIKHLYGGKKLRWLQGWKKWRREDNSFLFYKLIRLCLENTFKHKKTAVILYGLLSEWIWCANV